MPSEVKNIFAISLILFNILLMIFFLFTIQKVTDYKVIEKVKTQILTQKPYM